MKLISMTTFVLEQDKIRTYDSYFRELVCNYANFLNQPLTLGMFVPCDEDGNVLEEPKFKDNLSSDAHFLATEKYQQAKDKVLFEDCELYKDIHLIDKDNFQIVLNSEHVITITKNNKIEDLSFSDCYYLTPSAIKQLGL